MSYTEKMTRLLYTVLLYIGSPFLIMRLYWKGRRLPSYRRRIKERFCFGKGLPKKTVDVWIHAVSLGEVNAAIKLIEDLLSKKLSVMVTTMTPTGSERVQKYFKHKVSHQYLPYDLPWVIRRFYQRTQPKVGLILETELWPNLIYQAYKKQIPLILGNARISDKAIKQYFRARFFFKPTLNRFSKILAQSKGDAQRILSLGASSDIVSVSGNLKFDVYPRDVGRESYEGLKKSWGNLRPVVIAASTHQGEEETILKQLESLQKVMPDVLLLIAPRHPERFNEVCQFSEQMGWKTSRRSMETSLSKASEVIIIDTLGELNGFYSVCDYAFVGGSLVPIGGHNVLEPILAGVPVITGQYTQNSKAIIRELINYDAIQIANSAEDIVNIIKELYQSEEKRKHQVAQALSVLEQNRGALAYHIDALESCLQ